MHSDLGNPNADLRGDHLPPLPGDELALRLAADGCVSPAEVNLLLWSGLCFCLLALNNLLVVVDLLLIPDIDLSLVRSLTALAAGSLMLYGFIWEIE